MYKVRLYLISSVLIGINLVPILLIAFFQLKQIYLKQTIGRRLKEEILVTLKLPADKIVWEEEGRELVIDGKYFDVKDVRYKNGVAIVTGDFDEQETAAVNFLSASANNLRSSGAAVQWLLLLQCFVTLLLPYCYGKLDRRLSIFSLFQLDKYKNPPAKLITPPPRFFLFSE